MWYPAKAAFRAGSVSGGQWDDGNIGAVSVALDLDATASGVNSVAIGLSPTATGGGAVALGNRTWSRGRSSTALGSLSEANADESVAIGLQAHANGLGSVVLGSNANALTTAPGTFIFGDRSTFTPIVGGAPNEFLVRAAGGAAFYSHRDLTMGVMLAPNGGGWSSVSDGRLKENFRDLPSEDVLAKIATMPIREWNYKSQSASIRHVGPIAQDFHAAFGLDENPLRINTIDADGIALAAIKALERRLDKAMK
jgi:hypothetical protein